MNHIERPEAEIDGLAGGKDEDGGDDVVGGVRVGGVEAEGIAGGRADEGGAGCAVDAVGSGIAEVPIELDAGDLDFDGVGGGG